MPSLRAELGLPRIGKRHVEAGSKKDEPRRQRSASVSQLLSQRQRQIPSGGVAHENDVVRASLGEHLFR